MNYGTDRRATDTVRHRLFAGLAADGTVILAELPAELHSDLGRLRPDTHADAEFRCPLSRLDLGCSANARGRRDGIVHRASGAHESRQRPAGNARIGTG